MNACPNREQWQHFLAGLLDDRETPPLTHHAQGCARCQGTLEQLVQDAEAERWRRVRGECLAAHTSLNALPEDFCRRLECPPPGPLAGLTGEADRPTVPGYEVLRKLGRGGMGVVYLARQTRLNRLVALKMILAGAHAGAAERTRFQAEAEAAARLQHPHIVQIHEVGEADGRPFLAFEYVAGGSLAQRIAGIPQPPKEAVQLAETLARAIHAAHQQGIVHRDLKPANVLLTPDGTAKIADFGLAKRLDGGADQTHSGEILGTPSYMAPEQAGGRKGTVGPACDVYALGAIFYELLTGRPPFRGESVADTISQVLWQEPVPPRRLQPRVPRDLETICLKCLQKDPSKRYPSAAALAEDLACVLGGHPISARPVGAGERLWRWCRRKPALAALTLALVLALLGGVCGVLWYAYSAEIARQGEVTAREAVEDALTRALGAEKAEREARLSAEDSLYLDKIRRADLEWRASHLDVTERLLEECPPRFRHHWEWRYLKRLCHREFLAYRGHGEPIRAVAYSPDGRRLASVDSMGGIRIWDARTGQDLLHFKASADEIHALAFSPDHKYLVSAGSDSVVRVWEAETGQEIKVLRCHTDSVPQVAFSPDGRLLASASHDQTVGIWDMPRGELRHRLRGHTAGVYGVAFAPKGQSLATSSYDKTVKLWDPQEGREILTLRGHTQKVNKVVFNYDGSLLASASSILDNRTKHLAELGLWDLNTGKLVTLVPRHPLSIGSVAFSPDGQRLASTSAEQGIEIWDVPALREGRGTTPLLTLRGPTAFSAVSFSPDGKHLASVCDDTVVRIWDVQRGQEPLTLHAHRGAGVFSTAFGEKGQLLATADGGGGINLWRSATGELIHAYHGHQGIVHALAFSPTKPLLASGARDKLIKVWDVAERRLLHTLSDHTGFVFSLSFSPDGRYLASAGQDHTIRLWDCRSWQVLRTLRGHSHEIRCVTFAPDGLTLASASVDKCVKIWDVAAGQELRTLGPHRVEIPCLAFSPQGRYLVTGEYSVAEHSPPKSCLHLWDLSTGECVRELRGHQLKITGVAFSPDGSRVISSSDDKSVRVWDPQSGRELLQLRGHPGGVLALAVSPDGDRIASAGFHDTVIVWDATPMDP